MNNMTVIKQIFKRVEQIDHCSIKEFNVIKQSNKQKILGVVIKYSEGEDVHGY